MNPNFLSCICKTWQRTDPAHAGAESQWASRSSVGVRQTCCAPCSACLCFWGFLIFAPLVRALCWDKYILCCPPSLVNWVNTDFLFIISEFCPLCQNGGGQPDRYFVLCSITNCLELLAQTTGLFCSHIKRRCDMKPCIFKKYKFLSVSDRSHPCERSKFCDSL